MSQTSSLPPLYGAGTASLTATAEACEIQYKLGAELWMPADLCMEAVKLARRLQALPKGQDYVILLSKQGDTWRWSVNEDPKSEQP